MKERCRHHHHTFRIVYLKQVSKCIILKSTQQPHQRIVVHLKKRALFATPYHIRKSTNSFLTSEGQSNYLRKGHNNKKDCIKTFPSIFAEQTCVRT